MTDSVDVFSGGLSQSFKHGEKYKERLTNFRGSVERVTEDIIKFFGLQDTEGLTPFEIVLAADAVAQSGRTVARELGGTPVSEPDKTDAPDNDPWTQAASSQAPAEPEPEKPVDPIEAIKAQIDAAGTQTELKLLWHENKPLFDDKDLMAYWKAKGKGLPA